MQLHVHTVVYSVCLQSIWRESDSTLFSSFMLQSSLFMKSFKYMALLLYSASKSSMLLQPFASAEISFPTANQKRSVQLLQQLQCFPKEVWPLEK